MTSITCPCCQLTSRHPDDARNGYCGRCHWWTSDPELAPYHFALPCEHRGQGVVVPRLGAWYREARMIYRPDPGPFAWNPRLPVEITQPWLHTQPGTLLEIAGHIRGPRLPWWRRLIWSRHLRALRRRIAKMFR